MPARGSKVAPTGAAARQERARDSGGGGECKTAKASTRMAGEPDGMKTAANAKSVSVPLGKYFQTKAHSDMAAKQNQSADWLRVEPPAFENWRVRLLASQILELSLYRHKGYRKRYWGERIWSALSKRSDKNIV
ncbi:hypothetical protein NDU88_003042 [Pleurodeles waltl]|uniref:Uncharacterized protein n=1 Tax=Pleurodeles waltl TaxID=8319 RepID=A0AAV7VCA2_PLEWA|nr:hypothetical protein NDU88_003042 [Pleurodeles waltl]